MTISVRPAQAATLSVKARAFLKASPAINLPAFLFSWLVRPAAIPKQRAQFQAGEDPIEESLIATHKLQLERVSIAGVPVLKITPPEIDPALAGSIVLNIHGGGFVLGTARDRTALLTAAELRVPVWSIDYSLAPEARFPLAIHECLAVYRTVVAEIDPARIAGISSSAGVQIMLVMFQLAIAQDLPKPAALALYCPATDLSGVGDSIVFNARRDVMPPELALAMTHQNYVSAEQTSDAAVSPYYADIPAGFPPTVLNTGTRDLMLSNAIHLFWKLRDSGVTSELLVTDGGWHGFNWEPDMDEAIRARGGVNDFLRARLAGG